MFSWIVNDPSALGLWMALPLANRVWRHSPGAYVHFRSGNPSIVTVTYSFLWFPTARHAPYPLALAGCVNIMLAARTAMVSPAIIVFIESSLLAEMLK